MYGNSSLISLPPGTSRRGNGGSDTINATDYCPVWDFSDFFFSLISEQASRKTHLHC